MADPTRVKSSDIAVKLDLDRTGTYATLCGFTEDTITFGSSLEELTMQDCDDPTKVPSVIRDKVSTSISIAGNGVVAVESAEKVIDAAHDPNSFPCKIEMTLGGTAITWTGNMQVESAEVVRNGIRTATISTSMQSDGSFTKTTT